MVFLAVCSLDFWFSAARRAEGKKVIKIVGQSSENQVGDRWRVPITSLEGPASERNDLHGSCSCREIKEETAASRR